MALIGYLARSAAAIDESPCLLTLRATALVTGSTPTLGDVLVFDDAGAALAARIGSEPIAADTATPPTAISYENLRVRLAELGVSPGDVLIRGASTCRIAYAAQKTPPPATKHPASDASRTKQDTAASKPLSAKPSDQTKPRSGGARDDDPADAKTDGVKSLADVIRAHVTADLKPDSGTPQIEFERAGRELLDLTTPPFEFAVKALDDGRLGAREFNVVVSRDGRVKRMARVGLRVGMMKRVLVAERPLNAGTLLRAEDVRLEERFFQKGDADGLDHAANVVGRRLRRFVPAGGMVRADGLQNVDVVQRSQAVNVVTRSGAVRMNLNGTAIDAGSVGDTVRVRLGDSRREWREVRGVVTGPATVEIGEGV